jgi:hypothetical protein
MTSATIDGRVHREVIAGFVERGHPPAVDEVAAAVGITPDAAVAALRRLHDGHGVVLHPGSAEVWLAHPFAASPTAVWVAAGGRGWWAPCMWCAMGVATLAAPSATATIHVRYGGEHEPARLEVAAGAITAGGDTVVHFAIPPRDAWANVVHWCATVLPFRAAADVDAWCARHRLPRGAVVPVDQVLALGRAWYGRHLDADWRKWTVAEAQQIFDAVGLTGEHWRLPVSDRAF